jgi:hypothetical protein
VSQQINLFNPVFLKQKKYFSVITMLQALLLIALGSALFYSYAAYQIKQLAKQAEEAGKRYASEQARLDAYKAQYSPQQARQLLENQLKSAEARVFAQQQVINTLKGGASGNTVGYSGYMRAFARQTVNGLWLTGFSITGDAARVSMTGAVLAGSPNLIPAYVQKLGREPVMHGKSFASLQIRQPGKIDGKPANYVEFTLQSFDSSGAEK